MHADPTSGPGRHFFIDQTLDLRYDDNGQASASSQYMRYSGTRPASAPEVP